MVVVVVVVARSLHAAASRCKYKLACRSASGVVVAVVGGGVVCVAGVVVWGGVYVVDVVVVDVGVVVVVG